MKTVFLIDDDLDDREIFQEALQSLDAGTHYLEAMDGQEALEMIREKGFAVPDLMFVDLNMPRVGGLELLKELRKMPDYQSLPVYIYTTASAKAECDKCIEAGATGFITKHPSFDELCEELQLLLKV